MTDPQIVHVRLRVSVHEPDVLLAYANARAELWGFDPGHRFTVAEAAYESLVNNAPPDGPLGIGCEITDYTSE